MPAFSHTQNYCAVKDQSIGTGHQLAGYPCPHCGAKLPAKGAQVRVQVGEDGEAILPPPLWKRPLVLIAGVVVVAAAFAILYTGFSPTDILDELLGR